MVHDEDSPTEEASSWDDAASTWDGDPAVRAYAAAALVSLREVVPSLDGLRVLDFGCGTGGLAVPIAAEAASVVAVDASPAMIDVLRAKDAPRVHALTVPAETHALASVVQAEGPFDLVVASSVLAFVDDLAATLGALASGLRPGGRLVHWDWALDAEADAPFGLTPGAIREAMAAAGLTEVSVDVGFDVPFEGHRMRPLRGVATKP